MSTTEQDMLKILSEEAAGLGLADAEGLLNGLLEVERETANASDRRPALKRLSDRIDSALKTETEA